MAIIYQTRDGDVLDDICWRYYERVNVVIDVLNANPGIVEYGAVLPKGLKLVLPEISKASDEEIISLWD
ncbi:tail protein X [Vibrio sp. AK197]